MRRRDVLQGGGATVTALVLGHSGAQAQQPHFAADTELKLFRNISEYYRSSAADLIFKNGSQKEILLTLRLQPQVHPPRLYTLIERVKLFSKFSAGSQGEIGKPPLVPLKNEKTGLPYQGVRFKGGVLTAAFAAVEAPRRSVESVQEGINQGLGAAILAYPNLGPYESVPLLEMTKLTNAEMHGRRVVVAATVYENAADRINEKRSPLYLTGTVFTLQNRDALQNAVHTALGGVVNIHPLIKRGMLFVPSPEMESVLLLAQGTNATGAVVMDSNDAFGGVVLRPLVLKTYRNNEEESVLTVFLVHGPDTVQYAPRA
jgi:hypothetical protein